MSDDDGPEYAVRMSLFLHRFISKLKGTIISTFNVCVKWDVRGAGQH